MKYPLEPWRRRVTTWAVPLAVLLLGLVALVLYQAAFAGRVATLREQRESRVAELAALEGERESLQEFLDVAATGGAGIDELYGQHFATEAERFTRLIADVKELARRAGLQPTAFSYPRREMSDAGLVQRSISFSVGGTYDQLRTFVNFLELSDHFLILEQVELSQASEASRISIRLTLSTIFGESESRAARRLEEAAG